MKNIKIFKFINLLFITIFITFIIQSTVLAHCDTMDGPVVKAAQKALETGDVNLVLIWVQPDDEAVIRKAFEQTVKIRKLGPEAKDLADMYFFETLVRIHRAGEGVPYTGLKPAGGEVDPGIEAADEAIEKGSVDELIRNISKTVDDGIKEHFAKLTKAKSYYTDDLEGGRRYVGEYVTFIHYIEQLYQAATKPLEHHEGEPKTKEVNLKH